MLLIQQITSQWQKSEKTAKYANIRKTFPFYIHFLHCHIKMMKSYYTIYPISKTVQKYKIL